ncbi:hypothetical protein HS041_04915 [Planomonospora sp. ID67723]|uniref:hypothetical protein n=1 Tax=Planomonospora sp. ID67723 TaxID=2738134 RepID=UPI0018C3D4B6|nr:hypothetical protein [Planomonospora sp. ID67723]MBG0827102.1 hypothetical protein [Planomonospora sp. ID67723]
MGLAFVGVLVYIVINVVFAFIAFATGSSTGFAVVAGLLALVSFGGGILLVRNSAPVAKGLGIGLMIGWALVSIVSAGFCTGLNPELYR